MPRATAVTRRAAVKAERIVDTITLDHRSREAPATAHLQADGGLALELALPNTVTLNDGDALKLEDGGLVLVRAAAERLLEVRAENQARLLRAALLAGGAHALAQAEADALYILPDSALAEAIRGLGCSVSTVERAFSPDRAVVHDCCGHDHGHDNHDHGRHDHGGQDHGAQDHGRSHDHHDHGKHAHDNAHNHDHDHGHAAPKAHAHDQGCACGHDHGHDHR